VSEDNKGPAAEGPEDGPAATPAKETADSKVVEKVVETVEEESKTTEDQVTTKKENQKFFQKLISFLTCSAEMNSTKKPEEHTQQQEATAA